MKTEPRNQFTFYKSYYDAIQRLPKRDQSSIILAVCAYALYETEPSGLSGTASACFDLIRPTLDAGRRKAESGKKSGRKSSLYAKQMQTESEHNKELDKESDNEYECTQPIYDEDTIVEQIVALYHNLCPDLPPCHILSPAARRAILRRWAEHPDLEVFHQIFTAAQCSDLLTGKQVNWRANLDWLMEQNHFVKIYNGCYDNTAAKKQAVPVGGTSRLGEAEYEAIARVLKEPDTERASDEVI